MKEALASPKDEALKLALEALESINEMVDYEGNGFRLEVEIAAIKEALAQDEQPIIENYPEKDNLQQEPVAWIDIDEKGSASGLRYWSEPDNRHEVALYILR